MTSADWLSILIEMGLYALVWESTKSRSKEGVCFTASEIVIYYVSAVIREMIFFFLDFNSTEAML